MVLGCGSVSALRTMKRFFQVVPSPKQVAAGVVAVPPPAKKPKADDDVGPVRDPLSFITYNCNSLFARASRQQLESIIQYVLDEDPDMVSIQEVGATGDLCPAVRCTESRFQARLPALKQGGCVSRYAIGKAKERNAVQPLIKRLVEEGPYLHYWYAPCSSCCNIRMSNVTRVP